LTLSSFFSERIGFPRLSGHREASFFSIWTYYPFDSPYLLYNLLLTDRSARCRAADFSLLTLSSSNWTMPLTVFSPSPYPSLQRPSVPSPPLYASLTPRTGHAKKSPSVFRLPSFVFCWLWYTSSASCFFSFSSPFCSGRAPLVFNFPPFFFSSYGKGLVTNAPPSFVIALLLFPERSGLIT